MLNENFTPNHKTNNNNGTDKIFIRIAFAISKFNKLMYAPVNPQPGQGIPNNFFHMHGT